MKKQKILTIFLLTFIFLLVSLPFSQATPTYLAYNAQNVAAGYGQGWSVASQYYNLSQTFTALDTAYLQYVTLTVIMYDDVTGDDHPAAYFRCGIYTVDGSSEPNTATGLLELSDDVFYFVSTSETQQNIGMSFSFSGDTALNESTIYAAVFSYTSVYEEANNDYFRILSSSGGITGAQYYYSAGNWEASSPGGYDATSFWIIGDTDANPTPTPAPTASPSPTPFTYQGDIWAALVPYGTLILPLILILIVALICGKYAGVWGFFAGLNVASILVYAIMGASYFPLWGLVMLGVVDALLLFGKISGRF